MEYDERISNTVNEMIRENIDCLVISRPENMYYLTNYQTVGNPTQVLLLFRDKRIQLVTRELEASNAKHRTNIPYSFYLESQDRFQMIAECIRDISDIPLKVLGFEYNSYRLNFNEQILLEKAITNIFPEIIFQDCSLIVAKLRSIKSELEISYIKKAAHISACGLRAGVNAIRPGIPETAIAGSINKAMMNEGCEYTAYPCFVASGDRGCMGHYTPEQKEVQEGELLFMEIGGCYKRYHATKMHTIWVGDDPPDWFIRARHLIKKAIKSVRKIMKPGVTAGVLDAHMRDIIAKNNHNWVQQERSGYSIGIGFYTDWAENDIFKIYPNSKNVVYENMTCHLIPWVQIPGVGGIGFSDTVVVTKDGAISLFQDEDIPETFTRLVNNINKNVMLMSSQNKDHKILETISKEYPQVLDYYSDIPATPLVHRNDIIGNVFIKDESARLDQLAFKILGVTYAVHKLKEAGELNPDTILATMTDGNHGTAVASVAQKHGYACKIFVPYNMSEERKQRIRDLGAECIVCQGDYDDAIAQVKMSADENGWNLICDTSWDNYYQIPTWIACGYTKLFNEAHEQFLEKFPGEHITHLFLQAGVGGFAASGIAYALLQMDPPPKIICVEPKDADCIFENVKRIELDGKAISKGSINSIMAGLNCGQPSEIAWPLLRDYVTCYITLGDEWARKGVRKLYHGNERVYSGESGAAGLGGLLAALDRIDIRNHLQLDETSNILIVNTEGITDHVSFKQSINKNYY